MNLLGQTVAGQRDPAMAGGMRPLLLQRCQNWNCLFQIGMLPQILLSHEFQFPIIVGGGSGQLKTLERPFDLLVMCGEFGQFFGCIRGIVSQRFRLVAGSLDIRVQLDGIRPVPPAFGKPGQVVPIGVQVGRR